jgi:hypothetical protein
MLPCQTRCTDETAQLSEFASAKQFKYPVVLGQNSQSGSSIQPLLGPEDLARVSKDHSAFLSLLSERAKENGIDLEKQ